MHKKLLLAAMLMFSAMSYANVTAEISGVKFGMNYAEASKQFETQFGLPIAITPTQIAYKNKEYMGLKFQDVVFNFQKNQEGDTFLNEARLTIKSSTRTQAQRWVEMIAKKLKEKYPGMTWDLEDDGTKFYKGGTSPVNNSYLFTVYMYRFQGQYLAVLRYGPLPYVK